MVIRKEGVHDLRDRVFTSQQRNRNDWTTRLGQVGEYLVEGKSDGVAQVEEAGQEGASGRELSAQQQNTFRHQHQ